MFIKFKFNNITKKIKKEVTSFEQLKEEATKIFGNKVIYCDYLFEDEDLELVNITNDEDVELCFEEAKENNLKSAKIFLEISNKKTKNARSASQKKKRVQIQEEQMEEQDDDSVSVTSEDSFNEKSFKAITDSEENVEDKIEKVNEQIDQIKDQSEHLTKEDKSKIRGLKSQRKQMIRNVRNRNGNHKGRFRGRNNRFRNRRDNNDNDNQSGERRRGGMPDFVRDIIENNKKHGNPWKKMKELMNSVREEFCQFKGHPEMVKKLHEKIEEPLKVFVAKYCAELIAEHPELVEELKVKKENFEHKKEMKRIQKEERRKNKDARKEEKMKAREAKKAYRAEKKEARRVFKAEKQEARRVLKAQKKAEKLTSNAEETQEI